MARESKRLFEKYQTIKTKDLLKFKNMKKF